jgi:hypothetical protein
VVSAQSGEDAYSIIDLGDFFDDKPESVVRWLVALSMAANDLSFCGKLTREYGERPAECHYFFRLALSHLREIAITVGQAEQNKDVQIFISQLGAETRQVYDTMVVGLSRFDVGSLSKDVLMPIRSECFHYPDIKGEEPSFENLPEKLKGLDKKEIRVPNQGPPILKNRYLFVDLIVSSATNDRLSKEDVDLISTLTVSICQFVDHVYGEAMHEVKRVCF